MKIVFSHCTQCYPTLFSASNSKMEFLARGMMEKGAKVTVINSSFGEKDKDNLQIGVEKEIRYYIFPRKNNILLAFIKNFWTCLRLLQQERVKNDKNILFVGGIFPIFILQAIVAKLLGYKCVFLTQEWSIALNMSGIFNKINAHVSCYWYGYIMDAILPISHFLWEKNKQFNKPMLIVPILSEYTCNNKYGTKDYYEHFAYCAGAAYFRVIKMILDAFKLFKQHGGKQNMILVISGRIAEIQKVKDYVSVIGIDKDIIIKVQIPYTELIEIYRNALGLIIPLDPNSVADVARFSQKIAEYISTRRPIITSNVGEIPYYFTANKNAVIADYSAESYAKAMEKLAANENLANEIGEAGYQTGKEYFDYKINGNALCEFFDIL